jgi:hypothetical protein
MAQVFSAIKPTIPIDAASPEKDAAWDYTALRQPLRDRAKKKYP